MCWENSELLQLPIVRDSGKQRKQQIRRKFKRGQGMKEGSKNYLTDDLLSRRSP